MKSFLFSMLSLVCCVLLFGSTECTTSTAISPTPTSGQPNTTTATLMTKLLPNSTMLSISSVLVTQSHNMSPAYTTSMPNLTTISSVFPNNSSIIASTLHPVNFSVHHSSIFNNMSSPVIMSSSVATTNSSVFPNNSSIIASTSHPVNFSVHHSSIFMNMSSPVIMSTPTTISSAFLNHSSIISSISYSVNFSIHNSSIFMNMSSPVVMSSSIGNGSIIHNSTIHPTLPTSISNMSSTIIHNASSHILPTMTFTPTPVTTIVPTSTVLPTTPPPSPEGKYGVEKNGTTCLKIWLSLKFTIQYKNSSGKELHTNVVMPSNGTADGLCKQSLSSIQISWSHYSFEAYFHTAVEGSNGRWNTVNVTVTAQTVNNTDFINANESTIKHSVTNPSKLEWLSGKIGRSLNCSRPKILISEDKKMSASIGQLRIKPFEVTNDKFGEADSCNSKPTSKPTSPSKKKNSNTVAIAVGCSLAGLVLIVLIGYFIGKRRSRPGTGYRKL